VLAKVPSPASATGSTTGGSLSAGTYYYVVTTTTPYGVGGSGGGETTATPEVSATTTGSTSSIKVKWTQQGGATGYNIYRATSSGGERLLASVGASANSYTDTGAATPGNATPPSTNNALRTNCAPVGTPGHSYQMSAWYKTSPGATVRMVSYYRDSSGNWQFWQQQLEPASTAWTQAVWSTPPLPAGVTAVGTGFSLMSVGSLTVDDFFVGDLSVAP
jgi:hypothetical protein